ncbi:MAG TPA: hypothetical protein VF017_15515 [Thermoanaerobaculia bacterium]|nr:hypothetical protein [Thermoanaerobaculia bacterium]
MALLIVTLEGLRAHWGQAQTDRWANCLEPGADDARVEEILIERTSAAEAELLSLLAQRYDRDVLLAENPPPALLVQLVYRLARRNLMAGQDVVPEHVQADWRAAEGQVTKLAAGVGSLLLAARPAADDPRPAVAVLKSEPGRLSLAALEDW